MGLEEEISHRTDLLQRTVGKHPIMTAKFGGVEVKFLADTGSMVSMVDEDFFTRYLCSDSSTLRKSDGWLKITAANGLHIPYTGFAKMDVEVGGVMIPRRGIVVVRRIGKQTTPGLLGTNVLQHLPDFKGILGDTGSHEKGFLRVAGKRKILVPARSRCNVCVTGPTLQEDGVVEPLASPLPGDLMVPPSLVDGAPGRRSIPVINQSGRDVWLNPRTRLGVISRCSVETNDLQVKVKERCIQIECNKVSVDAENQQLPAGLDLSGLEGSPNMSRAKDMFSQYSSVFAKDEDDLGCTNLIKHRIVLEDPTPVRLPYRRIPPTQLEEFHQHLQKLRAKNIIRPSTSEYASPIVLVRKKSGGLRMCIDYCQLNKKTRKDAYPLPRIEESTDARVAAKLFSVMDLQSAYHQVEMEEEDKAKTAFTTPLGLYEFNRMLFGLCNSPATYLRLMQSVFPEEVFKILLVYIDDIIAFSRTEEEMLTRLEVIFQKLQQVGLKLEVSKCQFFCKKVRYLGHEISESGIATDSEKIRVVKEWPVPKSVREIRAYLGFTGYYRRYVKGFS